MFKHGEISTEVDKTTFIFTVLSFVCSCLTLCLILYFARGNYLGIFASILLGVLAISSFATIIGLLSDYTYIDKEKLFMNYVFKNSSISIKDIGNIKLKDDVYHVYDKKGDEVGSINAMALGIDKIINELNRQNVSFE